ncbi:Pre-mRNA splicing [Tieghemiomyces parasiticus]|uniref:RNA helicase n=1 Tax=Tieghemiomyces parasiticus TaxID=78921 RepID=A0A9W8A8J5_9FUNG|nr:Pre-mRNA splicing [Tieghemiomyces parasiticus]
MAEEFAKNDQYRYAANSNLVLQADRSGLARRGKEPTGEAETLWGKVDIRDMGTRAQRETAPVQRKAKKTHKRPTGGDGHGRTSTVLAAAADLEGLNYHPRTPETRAVLDLILALIHPYLGDQSQEVIRSAADEVLEILKNDHLRDPDRHKEIDTVLDSRLTADQFAKLVQLGKRITDYHPDDGSGAGDEDGKTTRPGRDADTLDDELGVAVVFDQGDEEDETSDEDNDNEDDDAAAMDEDNEVVVGAKVTDTAAANDEGDAGDSNERAEETMYLRGTQGAAGPDRVQPQDVDAFWLQRLIGRAYPDSHVTAEKTTECLALLASADLSTRECENQLMELFDYTHFDMVKLLTHNRGAVYWGTMLARSAGRDEEHRAVREQMRARGLTDLLAAVDGSTDAEAEDTSAWVPSADGDRSLSPDRQARRAPRATVAGAVPSRAPQQALDLEALAFHQGGHLMANRRCRLPDGSFKRTRKGYEEIHVPAPTAPPFADTETLIPIAELPTWAQPAFGGNTSLNRVQSRLYPAAFQGDANLLLCAPTGAGKTNVAMLTILRAVSAFRDPATGIIDADRFKIVYVAPMKALVQEVVGNLGARLEPLGLRVAELTGDVQLTKQQIAETQVLVTTPEKWDVVTRKATDRSYTNLVRLIIVDEIHLLHDDRGPVLESIVARTLRAVETTKEPVRLVGLSATLPNYVDVAAFLRVDPAVGLFHFDAAYRPCPLKQEFIGITERKAIKRLQVMNEVTYDKVMEQAGRNQTLVFVHSRKETVKTARAVRDLALERDTIGQFLRQAAASREVLQTEAATARDPALQELLPFGFAVHHAGLVRTDRTLVEELFADGHIQVLVSTATLAWGVNLPAHSVIIKGTQVYNPSRGAWTELSPQDVLQMLGRAGRPQFDTFGEGIIITTQRELQFYLSLLNEQLPIESQLLSRLPDLLNAEVALGTVRNRADAVRWLGYTYLYVRMLRNPALYGAADPADDPALLQRRTDLAHAAALALEKSRLIRYDARTGTIQGTELGRIASHYYLGHTSVATYDRHLTPTMGEIELFRLFALSGEFAAIPVREEEKLELAKLLERVPVPVKEGVDEPTAKVNVLLQAYISQLRLDGFALVADLVYVTQSAGRILRAMLEICLKCRWAQLARRVLAMCKMVERRMWGSMSPLRQFKFLPADLLRRLERKAIPWERFHDMDPHALGELVMNAKAGAVLHKCVHQVPRLNVRAHVQPVTRSLLRFELTLTPDFLWDERVHGRAEGFWLLVEDVDAEMVLYAEPFVLKQSYATDEHVTVFTVPLGEPLPPNYFVSAVSDRWLGSETRLPVSFKHLLLPDRYPPPTELLDMQALPVTALRHPAAEARYRAAGISTFNPVQTQTFNVLYHTDLNAFVGAPPGSGKTVCVEFALLRLWNQPAPEDPAVRRRAVYLAPHADSLALRLRDWRRAFPDRVFESLSGELTADLKLLERADVVLATPAQWDVVSRRWMQRRHVQSVGLVLADDLHMIGSASGPTYEVVVSRMRFMAAQLQNGLRLVGLATSLANARDVGDWLGVADSAAFFNFNPLVRPVPLEISIQSFKVPHFPSLMLAMARPAYLAAGEAADAGRNALVFVPSRRQCRLTAAELLHLAAADDVPDRFRGDAAKTDTAMDEDGEEDPVADLLSHVTDPALAELLAQGVGYYHETLTEGDRRVVAALFQRGALRALVAAREACWGLGLHAHTVVVMGAQYYDGREHRYADYPVPEVLQMAGLACRPGVDPAGRCVLLCQSHKKDFYKKFLHEPLPVESHLDQSLHDHFNAAVVTRTVENYQDAVDFLTWTFLYRRLTKNPNYYGLQGVSPSHLSDHLSELVETTLDDLAATKCIAVEDEANVTPLNLGMIAAYYNISYITIETFSISLTEETRLKGLLEVVSAAAEFEPFAVRHREDAVLRRIYERVPVKLARPDFRTAHVKCSVLLQAHFARLQLPPDLASDQAQILGKVIPLLQAAVDVLSSHGWLRPALAAMELAQMCVQAQWDTESPLKQVPFFTRDLIRAAREAGVESVFDLMEMEDADRQALLAPLQPRQIAEVAAFVNRYPEIEVQYDVPDREQLVTGQAASVRVVLEREVNDEDDEEKSKAAQPPVNVGPVVAKYFPYAKDEGWWLVLGDPKTHTLASIKRVNFQQRLNVKLDFMAPEQPGDYTYQLYLMCDSYLGCDQEFEVKLHVEPDDADEESGSESGEESSEN